MTSPADIADEAMIKIRPIAEIAHLIEEGLSAIYLQTIKLLNGES